ncbi:MAG: hypothetical protein FJ221_13800 [Lentisphaerae bacterium]|nr:hypothetical protein [Lentisphaerota bacterium]
MKAQARVAVDGAVGLAVGAALRAFLHWRIVGLVAMSIGGLLLLCALTPASAAAALRWKDRLVGAVGLVLTWSLLAPLFLVGFSLGHLMLRLTGRDPLRRGFPCRDASCWLPRAPSRGPAGYRNLY